MDGTPVNINTGATLCTRQSHGRGPTSICRRQPLNHCIKLESLSMKNLPNWARIAIVVASAPILFVGICAAAALLINHNR